MLSFSLFGQTPPTTRFEKTKELIEIVPLIQNLRKKEIEVNKAVNNNAADVCYAKSKVLTNLMAEVEGAIKNFVEEEDKTNSSQIQDLQIFGLVYSLLNFVKFANDNYRDTLNTLSSDTKEYVKNAIDIATWTTSIAIGVGTGSWIYGGGALVAASTVVDDKLKEVSGVKESRSATVLLIDALLEKLTTVTKALKTELEKKMIDRDSMTKVNFCCGISKEKLLNPIYCKLDNRIYEKNKIVEFINTHGKAPSSEQAIPEGRKAEDVLCKNINLYQAYLALQNMAADSNLNKSLRLK